MIASGAVADKCSVHLRRSGGRLHLREDLTSSGGLPSSRWFSAQSSPEGRWKPADLCHMVVVRRAACVDQQLSLHTKLWSARCVPACIQAYADRARNEWRSRHRERGALPLARAGRGIDPMPLIPASASRGDRSGFSESSSQAPRSSRYLPRNGTRISMARARLSATSSLVRSGNQCDALTGLDREARLDRIASAGNQFLLCRFDLHLGIVILPFVVFHSEAAKGDQNHPPSASTTIAGT